MMQEKMMNEEIILNISKRLTQMSLLHPNKTAVYFPKWNGNKNKYNYSTVNFKELEIKANQFAHQLFKLGLRKGDKTLLFLRPSLDFHAMVFALFKSGIIPVLIDPGMGRKNLIACIKEIAPVGLIAEKEIHFLRHFFPGTFRSVKFAVTTSKRIIPFLPRSVKLKSIKQMLLEEKMQNFATAEIDPNELCALLFTSGGTGIPKGVEYTHTIFNKQTDTLQKMFNLSSEDVDMAGFPLFSLFTLAMGMSTIIPDMDPSRPAKANPKKLAIHIHDLKPSFIAGSPAIWENLAEYATKHKLTFPSIKYVAMFGAPVSLNVHRKFKPLLPFGTTYTPYGATEALPVTLISGETILKKTAALTDEGHGTCIGLAAPEIEIKLIPITDNIIVAISDIEEIAAPNIPGEIIVKGPVVTKAYYGMSEKTVEAKIADSGHTFWHRMGDVGYFDSEKKLWFLGRKSHVLQTANGFAFPIPTEAIFNKHHEVKRSALVGIGEKGQEEPVIVIERKDKKFLTGREKAVFESELLSLAKNYPHTKDITQFFYSHGFPVDIRHNIKIDRLKLKAEIERHELFQSKN